MTPTTKAARLALAVWAAYNLGRSDPWSAAMWQGMIDDFSAELFG